MRYHDDLNHGDLNQRDLNQRDLNQRDLFQSPTSSRISFEVHVITDNGKIWELYLLYNFNTAHY